MDYRARATDVRNHLNSQLEKTIKNSTVGGISDNGLMFQAVTNSVFTGMVLKIALVDKYIEYVREEVPQDEVQALKHLIYAQESVGQQLDRNIPGVTMLMAMLTDEDFQIPTTAPVSKIEEPAPRAKDVVVLVEGYGRDDPIYVVHNGKQIGTANTATEEYESDCQALGLNPKEYR